MFLNKSNTVPFCSCTEITIEIDYGIIYQVKSIFTGAREPRRESVPFRGPAPERDQRESQEAKRGQFHNASSDFDRVILSPVENGRSGSISGRNRFTIGFRHDRVLKTARTHRNGSSETRGYAEGTVLERAADRRTTPRSKTRVTAG